MRKVFMAAAFVAAGTIANAQATFGIQASGISASVTEKYKYSSDPIGESSIDYKGRFSWKIGGVANIPVASSFSFMPQLNVLSKGGKIEEKGSMGANLSYETKGNLKLTYVELPLNFVYNTSSFFIGAGPSLSFGLSGRYDAKNTMTNMGNTTTTSQKVEVKFDGKKNAEDEDGHLKGFEFGANFVAGYKLSSGLFIQANYNLGLSDNDPDDNPTTKNKYFGVGIGYFFGGKK